MQKILSNRVCVAWFGIQNPVSSTQGEIFNFYIFVGQALQFHFWSRKAFFVCVCEMSIKLDKLLRSSEFSKLVLSSILAKRKYNLKGYRLAGHFHFSILIYSFATGTDSVLRSNGVGSHFHVCHISSRLFLSPNKDGVISTNIDLNLRNHLLL